MCIIPSTILHICIHTHIRTHMYKDRGRESQKICKNAPGSHTWNPEYLAIAFERQLEIGTLMAHFYNPSFKLKARLLTMCLMNENFSMARGLNCSQIIISIREFFQKCFNPTTYTQSSEIKLQNIYLYKKFSISVRPEKKSLMFLLWTTRWQ